MSKALGMIETKGLIGSITAADAMVKSSDVRLVKQEKISAALVTVFVEGDVSAVMSAIEAGKVAAEVVGELIDSHVIPHPDQTVGAFLKLKDFQNHSTNTSEPTVRNKSTDLPLGINSERDKLTKSKSKDKMAATIKDDKNKPAVSKANEKKATKTKPEVKKSSTPKNKEKEGSKIENKKSDKEDEK